MSDIPKIRKVSETSIKNVERVLNYNGYSEELRNMFSEDVNTLVFAINLQIDIIRDYLRDNCSELEYNNVYGEYKYPQSLLEYGGSYGKKVYNNLSFERISIVLIIEKLEKYFK